MKPTASEATATSNQSVFNLINAVLGVGVLGFPYAFKTSGLALATCLVFFIGAVTLFSVRLLLLSSQMTGKKSYDDIAFHLYGRPGVMCINFCILVINLGAMVSYLNVLADVLSSVSGTIIPPGLEPSRGSVLLGITVLAVLPVSVFVQDAASLACVSISSVSIIFLFTFVMVLSAMRPMADINVIRYWDPKGAFVSFPVIAYGFTIHTVIFPIYTLLRSASVPKMSRIVRQATWLCALVYLMVGMGGYLTFGKWTHGDILRNLGAQDSLNDQSMRWMYERLLKLSYGASIVGTIPLVILPSLSLLAPLADPYLRLSRVGTKRVIALLFVGVSYMCAVLIPNVEFILGLNGGTSSILISYIMPGLIYLKASTAAQETSVLKVREKDHGLRWKAKALVVLGVILGIVCTSATLKAVHQEQEVVTLVQNIVDKNKEMEEAAAMGQKTLHAVKAVDAVETASRGLGDARGETEETLDTLHSTVQQLNATLDSANKTGTVFWYLPEGLHPQKKQKTAAYKTVLETIGVIVRKVQATLDSVETLQVKLKSLAQEIKNERTERGVGDSEVGGASETKVDSLVKDLTAALGISVEEEEGFTERTLDAVQKEFDIAIDALRDTQRMLEQVENVIEKTINDGKEDSNLKELVVSAMDQAIHATQHSALALDLTSNALSDTAADQKSELISLLKIVVEDYEREGESHTLAKHTEDKSKPRGNPQRKKPVNKAEKEKPPSKDHTSMDKLTKIVKETGNGSTLIPADQSMNVTEVELRVKAVINETAAKKQSAVSEAHAAVQRAHPTVAEKAGDITKEINPAAKAGAMVST